MKKVYLPTEWGVCAASRAYLRIVVKPGIHATGLLSDKEAYLVHTWPGKCAYI